MLLSHAWNLFDLSLKGVLRLNIKLKMRTAGMFCFPVWFRLKNTFGNIHGREDGYSSRTLGSAKV